MTPYDVIARPDEVYPRRNNRGAAAGVLPRRTETVDAVGTVDAGVRRALRALGK